MSRPSVPQDVERDRLTDEEREHLERLVEQYDDAIGDLAALVLQSDREAANS